MEQITNINSIQVHFVTDKNQIATTLENLRAQNSNMFVLFPNPDNTEQVLGFILRKYYNPLLAQWYSVADSVSQDEFQILTIDRASFRSYWMFLARRFIPPRGRTAEVPTEKEKQPAADTTDDWVISSDFFDVEEDETPAAPEEKDDPITAFLKSNTPLQIEQALNEKVIGQSALTKAVADFLYYHALRQLHPDLPQRPLLIAGPSGSGKTEVWRVASKLYGHLFPIKVIDGSNISCEGWSGNYKIDTYLNQAFALGGILVVDEFDKLAKPKHSGSGDNVSQDVQAEFLKLVEGEYHITEKRKQTSTTTKQMGFVLVGAFESLWIQKEQPKTTSHIGFCLEASQPAAQPAVRNLTDEDFIRFGIIPELVGRIAVKCATKPLDDEAYWNIIRGPHSRVAAIEQVLRQYGTNINDVISQEELRQMVATSKSNRTGVRWVSAQVETRLLEAIREQGLFPGRAA